MFEKFTEFTAAKLKCQKGLVLTDYLFVIGMVVSSGVAAWALLGPEIASLVGRIIADIGGIF